MSDNNLNELKGQGLQLEALESIKKHIIVGNVFRIVGIVIFTLIGLGVLTLQTWNAINTTTILNNVNSITEEMFCTGNNSSNPLQIYNTNPYDPDLQVDKPLIYLYPEEDTNVNVTLELKDSEMVTMWPDATVNNNIYSWDVLAKEDGTLFDENGNEYSYLFWEATGYESESFDEGFCVKGSETGEFLREKLAEIGLTPEEYNEFIVYWLPKMQNNEYNLIRFDGLDANDAYNRNYALTVTDENGNSADSVLRVMMVWEGTDTYTEIEPQEFETFERNGFTVVEWGGTELK